MTRRHFTVGGAVVNEEDESVITQEAEGNDIPFYRTTEIELSIGAHFPKTDVPEMIDRLRSAAAAQQPRARHASCTAQAPRAGRDSAEG